MTAPNPRPAVMEAVEGRRLMSATLADAVIAEPVTRAVPIVQLVFPTYLSNGTLIVDGSANGDTISISQDASNIRVNNRGYVSNWSVAAVSSIRVNAGDGNDWVTLTAGVNKPASIDGDDGNDQLWGGLGNDAIYGGDGYDYLNGMAGHDFLDGGAHDDHLAGGDGNDVLHGRDGNDSCFGGVGDDDVYGSFGNDHLDGGADNDEMYGGWGNDRLDGWTGNDVMNGGWGHDRLDGGAGADYLDGDLGDDVLIGGAGIDDLRGNDGNDTLHANADGSIDNVDGGLGFDTAYVDPTTHGEIIIGAFIVPFTILGDNVAGVEQVFS